MHCLDEVFYDKCQCKNFFFGRFCPDKYHPFDQKVQDKYVVGDDYLPTWKVPSLATYYSDFGFGMKRSFDAWLAAQDKVCII